MNIFDIDVKKVLQAFYPKFILEWVVFGELKENFGI